MEFVKLLVLAIIQGATEFLPVSSSGHLVVFENFLGLESQSQGVFVELVLHLGTLFSVIVYYRKKILELVRGVFAFEKLSLMYAGYIILTMVPAGLGYKLFGDSIKEISGRADVVAWLLVLTGLMMLSFRWIKEGNDDNGIFRWWKVILIGIGQAVAMLPGISRSGTTIWVSRLLKIPSEKAAEFSFLMSLPVIAGAALVEVLGAGAEACAFSFVELVLAMIVAFIVGCMAIHLLVRMLVKKNFWVFGVYCLIVGLVSAILINFVK